MGSHDTNSMEDPKLKQCLTILAGNSDEHKFAGLLMITKHLQTEDEAVLQYVRREVVKIAGVPFFVRLLHTQNAQDDGVSPFRSLALNLISSFCLDTSLAPEFATDTVLSAVLEVLPQAILTQKSVIIHDCVQILHGLLPFEIFKSHHGQKHIVEAIHACAVDRPLVDADLIHLVSLLQASSSASMSLDSFTSLCETFAAISTPSNAKCELQDVFIGCLASDSTAALFLTTSNVRCLAKGLFGAWPAHTHRSTRRDTSLRLLERLVSICSGDWLLEQDGAAPPVIGLTLQMAAIESKLLLDDAERILIDMEIQQTPKDTVECDEILHRIQLLLPACYTIAEAVLESLTNIDNADSLSNTMLLHLKETLGQMFTVIIQYLTTCRDAIGSAAFQPSSAFDAITFATIRVLGAWMAQETDLLEEQLVVLIPFLVTYEPQAVEGGSDADSDDEVDTNESGNSTLPFLLPGLLQLTATSAGAAAVLDNERVLQRLLQFTGVVCSQMMASKLDDGVGTLTMCLGICLNILLVSNASTPHRLFKKALPMLQSLTALTWKQAQDIASDEYVLLLHLVACVALMSPGLPTELQTCFAWIRAHPPSIDVESTYDLHELVLKLMAT
ncbi:hypothetical protein AC1031_013143 [Aphanomyces cochlioides]|nr:hypothetical protein AC1031_013143 [Aphanomyces cochlioides]